MSNRFRRRAFHGAVFLLFTSCVSLSNQQPILTGTGRDLITAEAISTVSELTQPIRGEAANIWMLDGHASPEKDPKLYALEVLFSPENSTGRVLRCHSILCTHAGVYWPGEHYSSSSFTLIRGWYFYHRNQPGDYCWIVHAGRKITNKPVGERYYFSRNLTDADLIALFDATKGSITNATIMSFESRDPSHTSVWTSGEQWVVEFEKKDNVWKETDKMPWIE